MLPRAGAWTPRPSWTLHLLHWPYAWWAAVELYNSPPGLLMIIRQRRPSIQVMEGLLMVALHQDAHGLISLIRQPIGFYGQKGRLCWMPKNVCHFCGVKVTRTRHDPNHASSFQRQFGRHLFLVMLTCDGA